MILIFLFIFFSFAYGSQNTLPLNNNLIKPAYTARLHSQKAHGSRQGAHPLIKCCTFLWYKNEWLKPFFK